MKKTRGMKKPAPAGRPASPARVSDAKPRHQSKTEEMFHGLRACEAIFARRPQEIVRVYVSHGRQRHFATLLELCARERKGFQIVADENLERLTGSVHHEGIAILAKQVRRQDLTALLGRIETSSLGPLVYLDGVQNPHNLGSILRTAAHFGAGAILGRSGDLPPLSPAAVRVAEGAAEFVPVCDLVDPVRDLERLKKAGWRVVVTSSHRGEPLFGAALGKKTVLVLGSEGEGVSRPIEAIADLRARIPGTGAIESLNVSVACGIVLAEAVRGAGGPVAAG
ncbi:MAG: TrmH family RNA methyltransferase [Planctomycetia bacterium]